LEKSKETGPVDLALVDWNMPEMNGYEFVCTVRKDDQYKDMRLMMVTTETEMAQVVKALEAGADEYVMKPFTKEMIVEKLAIMGLSLE
jgi:two-component system chemotaxis response regulator CheY